MTPSRPLAFEDWAIAAGFAYRDKHGFWFSRNGGDGLLDAWAAGAAAERATISSEQQADPSPMQIACAHVVRNALKKWNA
jgi:hypothetical protein